MGGKKIQPGTKSLARTSIVTNGDSEPDKKSMATISIDNSNGPLSLDGNATANGSISSDQDRAISESPATTSELSGPSDTQSVCTADSIDLDDARTLKKPTLEIENRSAVQVSSV
jgi:hypothetical protein